MTPQKLKQILPRASQETIRLNSGTDSEPQGSEPQPSLRNEPLAAKEGKTRDTTRYVVSIKSYRVRLCDPDNLCGKYYLDSLRYARIIPDDREEDIIYQISQKKVAKKTQEKTLVRVEKEA